MAGALCCVQLPSWTVLRRPFSHLAFQFSPHFPLSKPSLLLIRMGGGPRTYPGGVTKWQWKKMQNKKAKQILKARLLRERQLYEMRKRAELKAAMAKTNELEKPWEKTAPTLFSVTADDQLQTMADRFVKPGAVDLWTENDGPHQPLRSPAGHPSVRIFPKDALHSTKPYARVFHSSTDSGDARSAPSDARSARSGARSSRSETSSEQAPEYAPPERERNGFSKSARFRSQNGKFRGDFRFSEKSERYKIGRGSEGSMWRNGGGVKGLDSGFYSQGADYGLGKSNGYLQMNGVQSFAGFDLGKGSWQKGKVGKSSDEDDYDYDSKPLDFL